VNREGAHDGAAVDADFAEGRVVVLAGEDVAVDDVEAVTGDGDFGVAGVAGEAAANDRVVVAAPGATAEMNSVWSVGLVGVLLSGMKVALPKTSILAFGRAGSLPLPQMAKV
jgi:hypothetical protein